MGTYSNLFKQTSAQAVKTPPASPSAAASKRVLYPKPARETIPPERFSERTEKRTEKRSELPTLPIKRRTKRYSFEFYEDQLTRLKQLKRAAEDRGDSLSLSDMAREAFDLYLQQKS